MRILFVLNSIALGSCAFAADGNGINSSADLASSFYEQHQAAIESPPTGMNRLLSSSDEQAMIQREIDGYLSLHSDADPTSCKFKVTHNAMMNSHGNGAAADVWLKGLDQEVNSLFDPNRGQIVYGLASSYQMTQTDLSGGSSTQTISTYDEFKAAVSLQRAYLESKNATISGIKIALRNFTENYHVPQAELQSYIISVFGITPDAITYENVLDLGGGSYYRLIAHPAAVPVYDMHVHYYLAEIACRSKSKMTEEEYDLQRSAQREPFKPLQSFKNASENIGHALSGSSRHSYRHRWHPLNELGCPRDW